MEGGGYEQSSTVSSDSQLECSYSGLISVSESWQLVLCHAHPGVNFCLVEVSVSTRQVTGCGSEYYL